MSNLLQAKILQLKILATNLINRFKRNPKELYAILIAVFISFIMFVGIKSYINSRAVEASDMLAQALNISDSDLKRSELESVWNDYPGTSSGILALYNLSIEEFKKAENESALEHIELFLKKGKHLPPLSENCLNIKGRILERMEKFDGAADVYAVLSDRLSGESFISAKIDEARCLRLSGKRENAINVLEMLNIEDKNYKQISVVDFMISELKR